MGLLPAAQSALLVPAPAPWEAHGEGRGGARRGGVVSPPLAEAQPCQEKGNREEGGKEVVRTETGRSWEVSLERS